MFRFVIFCLAVASVSAYSKGAPREACGDMVPQHHVAAQTSKVPYSFELSKGAIRAGDTITITIKGNDAEKVIKGLLVQARVGNSLVGQFNVGNSPYIQVTDCDNGAYNAVTHQKFAGAAPQSVSFSWTAPKKLSERVVFYFTVAQNGGVFWVAQKSEPLAVSA